MSQIYTIVCENIAVTAAQDVLAAYASATKKLQLLAVELAANGQTTIGNYPLRLRNMSATVTSGSVGSAITPKNIATDGPASSFTARRNDTTQASSSTVSDVVATQFNPINGYYWEPPKAVPAGDEPQADLSGAFVLSLDSVVGTLNISATMWVRER